MQIEIVQMKKQMDKYAPELFIPLQTNTPIDEIFSSDRGIMPGTNSIITGAPGVGKSTVLMDVLAQLQQAGKKVLFVSGEMNDIDLYGYVKRYPLFGELPILFLGEYFEEDPQEVLKEVLKEGYDIVLIDSMAEVVEVLRDAQTGYASKKKVENWLLNLLDIHNKGNNKEKKYTAFLVIQQVTKSGAFAGSNRIKHMTTAMFHMEFDEIGERYLYFSKNRRGGMANRLYFNLNKGNSVGYGPIAPLSGNEDNG